MSLGINIYNKLEELSKISMPGDGVTRLYLSKEHKEAITLLDKWMKESNLTTYIDELGNLIGEYKCDDPNAQTLIIGSHQDTVKCGGKYDGALGVVMPIVCAGELIKEGKLNCNLKVVAFSDEEGVRFMTTYLGSKGLAGTFDDQLLERVDSEGITLRDALIDFGFNPDNIASCKHTSRADAYLEIHIEQGPVLQSNDLAVGIVSAIQSSHRYEFIINGVAGHAGTVPMQLRNDPMHFSARLICSIMDLVNSKEGIVATVGMLEPTPGAPNVIPSKVKFSLDIRCIDENEIIDTIKEVNEIAYNMTKDHTNINYLINQGNKVGSTLCDDKIIEKLEESFRQNNVKEFRITSGAGHDAQEMKNLCDIGMLFVRCKDGISHNPLESVTKEDVDVAANIVCDFMKNF